MGRPKHKGARVRDRVRAIVCSFFPPCRTFNYVRRLKDRSALRPWFYFVKRKAWGYVWDQTIVHAKISHVSQSRLDSLRRHPLRWLPIIYLFYAMDIRRTLSLTFSKTEKPFATIGFFKGPRQLLGLNHHSVNLTLGMVPRGYRASGCSIGFVIPADYSANRPIIMKLTCTSSSSWSERV